MAQHNQADNLPLHSPQIYLSKWIKAFGFICWFISTNLSLLYIAAGISVADPHHFDADPDPACHFDADADPDPDPACQFYANPDPGFSL